MAVQSSGSRGSKREPPAVVAEAAEAVDQRAPHAAGRRDVDAVGGVVVPVGEVDEQGVDEVAQGEVAVADLGGDDRLHDGRQRRVAGGDRVVVLEVGALLLGGEQLALQEQRQHDVGLLEHLEPVDDQRVVVQQQRPLRRAACSPGPTPRARGSAGPAGGRRGGRRTGSPWRRRPAPTRRSRRRRARAARRGRRTPARRSARARARPRAAWRRLNRAITLVNRLSLTTVVYSSGPVTPWMWNSLSSCQKPRSAHIRAVSTRMSMPSRMRKSRSPVAATYCASAYAMSALMWYCAVPAA